MLNPKETPSERDPRLNKYHLLYKAIKQMADEMGGFEATAEAIGRKYPGSLKNKILKVGGQALSLDEALLIQEEHGSFMLIAALLNIAKMPVIVLPDFMNSDINERVHDKIKSAYERFNKTILAIDKVIKHCAAANGKSTSSAKMVEAAFNDLEHNLLCVQTSLLETLAHDMRNEAIHDLQRDLHQ